MRLVLAALFIIFNSFQANAITLYNSRDSKTQSPSSQASEILNQAFSKMFEFLALVERRSDRAGSIQQDAVKQFRESARLFMEVSQNASDEKVVPKPRNEEERQTVGRMLDLSKSYGVAYNDYGEFSEKRFFEQLSKILNQFASRMAELKPTAFAGSENDRRVADQFLLHAIRLQDFGRVTTAYLAIPR